jgi:hypothetical protein
VRNAQLYKRDRAILIRAARELYRAATAADGPAVLPLYRRANSYLRAARELNHQYVRYLRTTHGTTTDLFEV